MKIEYREFSAELDWAWVRLHANILRVEDTTGIIAVDLNTGDTVAAVIMDNFTDTSCQCHLIIINPMVIKHGLEDVFRDFVFKFKKMVAVYGWVPANNKKAVKLNIHMGWKVRAVFEGGYSKGVDYLLMELKEDTV
tara:strand:+ start:26070 stop:26477 length:408 start_codon:yes stop_codon:yes gene_type:complete